MKNMKVTVNGQTYNVTVEEVDSFSEKPAVATVPEKHIAPSNPVETTIDEKPAPQKVAEKHFAPEKPAEKVEPVAKVANPEPMTTETPSSSSDNEVITAPMPGVIVDIKVTPGQKVVKGDLLLTFEAMKMENDIIAYRDATVVDILVSKGDNMDSGTELLTIN